MHSKKLNLNTKGFSLIELMIVVAIIGLLAAIGIPQYSKFQAKARTTEAKGHLSAIFTAESSFQSEWTAYTTDLVDLGVSTNGTNLRYAAGFNGGCAPATSATNAAAPAEAAGNANGQMQLATVTLATAATWASTIGTALVTLNGAPTCVNTVGAQTYIASATGDPRNNPVAVSGTSDTWTINQIKTLSNPITGL
jgi:type IV pilus assembly protein PilA